MKDERVTSDTTPTGAFWIMTANLGGQDWMGFGHRKHAAAEVLRTHAADIIGFQEFAQHNWEVLGPSLPNHERVAGAAIDNQGETLCVNTVAFDRTRFEARAHSTLWLAPDGMRANGWDGGIRAATVVHFFDRETERTFVHINAHLDNIGKVARTEGVRFILSHLETDYAGQPVVFTADSNVSVASVHESWKDPEMRKPYELMLEAGFIDAWHGPRPRTYHGFKGESYEGDGFGTYDTEWIMVRGFEVSGCELIQDSVDGVWPSDHYWMKACIRLTDSN